MNAPRVFDTFMFNNEFDVLSCRLYELRDVPHVVHVAIEADVDHQDHRKPYHLTENRERFAEYGDRLRIVRAHGLPTVAENPDPWARELAQREWAFDGMRDAEPGDIVLHGDVDEIPNALGVRNVRPSGYVAFDQTLFCFAVDWLHPERWRGTVAARYASVSSLGYLRSARNMAPAMPGALAGWHLSWLGGRDAALAKLGSFCHPEIADRTLDGLRRDEYLTSGYHVDGKRLIPVDVDRTWPQYVYERKCPASWFRPR